MSTYSSQRVHANTVTKCNSLNDVFYLLLSDTLKLNSVALVRERTIPTERPPPVGEVSANFCG